VVEGGGLENRCPERDRGFESCSLRQRRAFSFQHTAVRLDPDLFLFFA
jgi:hypothetical protein